MIDIRSETHTNKMTHMCTYTENTQMKTYTHHKIDTNTQNTIKTVIIIIIIIIILQGITTDIHIHNLNSKDKDIDNSNSNNPSSIHRQMKGEITNHLIQEQMQNHGLIFLVGAINHKNQ